MSVVTSTFASMSLPNGWYVEGNVGSSRATNKTYGSNTSTKNTGFGFNLDAGYKFAPYFAAEVGYTSYAKTTVKSAGTNVAKDTHYSYDIAGKGIFPVSDTGLELFAKVGLARSNSHVVITNSTAAAGLGIATGTSSSSGLYLALGGDYSFMPTLAVNAQWAQAKGNSNTGTLSIYTLGLTWLFA
jgi:hypothetical protein